MSSDSRLVLFLNLLLVFLFLFLGFAQPLDTPMMASHDNNASQPETQSINNPMCVPTTLEEKEQDCGSMDSANSNTFDLPADLPTNLMH